MARESDCWLEAAAALIDFIRGGEEHRICRGDDVYHKATYPGRYGFTVIAANGQPTLTHALTGEYLNRLLLSKPVAHAHALARALCGSTRASAVKGSVPSVIVVVVQPNGAR